MRITANGAVLAVPQSPMLVSSLEHPQTLRENFRRDGYVLLRQVLDRDRVMRLRGAYFGMFEPSYLAHGTAPHEGVWSGQMPHGLPPHGHPGHPAYAFVRSKEFARFVNDQRLLEIAELLLDGAEMMRLPRQIVRHYHKGLRAAPAHTEFDCLDGGSGRVLTMWIPLGDCPVQTGGLAYLEGSHRIPEGRLEVLKTKRTGDPEGRWPMSHDLAWTQRQLGGRWLYADYKAGDVAIHSPHLVHGTFDTTTDAMRLSADIRFLPIDVEPDARWLRPWSGDDGD